MVRVKTSELEGSTLNYCVDYIVTGQWPDTCDDGHVHAPDYAADWSQGGPLIEQHRVKVEPIRHFPNKDQWLAGIHYFDNSGNPQYLGTTGISALNAACRAIVAANLGDEVDVPEELA